MHAEVTWTDQTDPAHQEEQSPSEVLSVGAPSRQRSLDRPQLRRAHMAWLSLLAVAGAVLCIKSMAVLRTDRAHRRHRTAPLRRKHRSMRRAHLYPDTRRANLSGTGVAGGTTERAAVPNAHHPGRSLRSRASDTDRRHAPRPHLAASHPRPAYPANRHPNPLGVHRRRGFPLAQPRQSQADIRQRLHDRHRTPRFHHRGRTRGTAIRARRTYRRSRCTSRADHHLAISHHANLRLPVHAQLGCASPKRSVSARL